MTDAWPCPECGEMIGDTGMSSRTGLGPVTHERHQHIRCPNCDAFLERSPDREGDRGWRVKEMPNFDE